KRVLGGIPQGVAAPERVTRMASAEVSAPTPGARLGGLTPGRRPGAHRDQPPPAGPSAAVARSLTPGRPAGVRPQTLIVPNPGAWPRGWPTQTVRAVDNRAAVEEAMQGRPRDASARWGCCDRATLPASQRLPPDWGSESLGDVD